MKTWNEDSSMEQKSGRSTVLGNIHQHHHCSLQITTSVSSSSSYRLLKYILKKQTNKTEGWGHFFNFHMILFFPSAYTEKASLHFCITTFFVFPWTDDHAYNYTPTLTQTASYFWWNWPCIHLHTHIYPNSKLFLMERIMHTTAHPHLPKQQVIFDGTDHAYNCTPTIT